MKTNIFSVFAMVSVLMAGTAYAVSGDGSNEQSTRVAQDGANPQDCMLVMATRDPNNTINEKFKADSAGQFHGPKGTVFAKGDYSVEVVANEKWMTLVWKRGSEDISRGVMGFAGTTPDARVMLVPNPKDPTEQLSLTCYSPKI